MGLNLDLDPTKTLRTKLGTIKDGVIGGKDKLASVPDDLKDIGLKDGTRNISFHSFRHSIETHLTNKNVNTRFIDYLQGHSQKGVGGDVYLKDINPQSLYEECVLKIDL